MTFRGPDALYDPATAARILQRYYAGWDTDDFAFTGSKFDAWRGNDPDRFTPDDLVAVTFLSVEVPPRAAYQLLDSEAKEFSQLLIDLPQDVHLASASEIGSGWWELMAKLKDLPGVGATTASKLYARKRPHLRPIYDRVIEAYLGADKQQWEPLRQHLAEDKPNLWTDLETVISETDGVPRISPLRALDVICWMEGKAGR